MNYENNIINLKSSNNKLILLRVFLYKYLLPLCGVTVDQINNCNLYILNNNLKYETSINTIPIKINGKIVAILEPLKFDQDNDYVKTIFSEGINVLSQVIKMNYTSIPKGFWFDSADKPNIMFDMNDSRSIFYENMFKISIEKTICKFLCNSKSKSSNMEKLISILDSWSKKTYEGHHVCYGFLISDKHENSPCEPLKYVDSFLSFLEDEYSAVISDGMSSLFKIDTDCNFNGFVSVTDIYKTELLNDLKNFNDSYLPYRFYEIINSYVIKENIGLFLLQNGDIIIAKNKEICFIRRNGKWMNFSRFTFVQRLRSAISTNSLPNTTTLLKNIYTTSIDVSLAHTGGIIALVKDSNVIHDIISDIDNLTLVSNEDELFFNEFKEKSKSIIGTDAEITMNNIDDYCKNPDLYLLKKDIIKRLTKRFYLRNLIGTHSFSEIDRKLRAELIGLDGACIIDSLGNIISFGAIITNDSGSSGGGRGAAAKKLSNYSGFAIKISTDGYIEIYSNSKKIHTIK